MVHYFQYDNYSRRVVSKKVKGKGPSELLKKKQTKEVARSDDRRASEETQSNGAVE